MKRPHYQVIIVPLLISLTTLSLVGGEPNREGLGIGVGGGPGGAGGTSVFTSKTTNITHTVTVASVTTPLENALELWRKGDQSGAVEKFLQIDWSKSKTPFHPEAPLSTREQDLAKMAAGDRETLLNEVNGQLRTLKQLAGAVHDKALAATDKPTSRRQFAKLDECGASLHQPDALLILKLTARSIRKLAATDSRTPGK